MNVNEAAERLGLEHPAVYARRGGVGGGRGTGRTTKMLIEAALVALDGRPVRIKAFSAAHAVDLVRVAREMFAKLGGPEVKGSLIQALRDPGDMKGSSAVLFVDHYLGDPYEP